MPIKYDLGLPKKLLSAGIRPKIMNMLTFYFCGMISMSHTDLMQFPPFRRLVRPVGIHRPTYFLFYKV